MTWQRTVPWLFILMMVFTELGACSAPQQASRKETMSAEPTDMIAMIHNDPTRFESKTVTVTAGFQGWRGPCRTSPPVSRSDWMITNASGCLYVHGPMPADLDPARPSGEEISVTGVVRLKMGMPYLETDQ